MDVFKNTLNPENFTSTNNIWNLLGLNSPTNVGMVSELINEKPFENKEDWEEYYYIRGRNKEHLASLGKILYDNLPANCDFTLNECIECVRYRVICETWNGIVIREVNTIKTLTNVFENFTYRKTSGIIDNDYAVDYEVYYDSNLVCGIQIKPISYEESNAEHLQRARRNNLMKNEKYTEKFGVPVVNIISELNGAVSSNKGFIMLNKIYRKYDN